MRDMEYKVDGKKKKTNLDIDGKLQVNKFLERVGENRESVIVKINGKIVTEFDYISKEDKIELIKIASGG